jgi:hypothetical protein
MNKRVFTITQDQVMSLVQEELIIAINLCNIDTDIEINDLKSHLVATLMYYTSKLEFDRLVNTQRIILHDHPI